MAISLNATDTARQIADLRAQGEFQKADTVLELTQTYLGQLMDLEKWGAEFNLGVDQFNSQIERWQADFDASVGEMLGNYKGVPTLENQKFQTSVEQWNKEFDFTVQQAEKKSLADSGIAVLNKLEKIEDGYVAERTKIGEIIDVIEGTTEDGLLTQEHALKLLRQYGLH